jgi:hypothetical protein
MTTNKGHERGRTKKPELTKGHQRERVKNNPDCQNENQKSAKNKPESVTRRAAERFGHRRTLAKKSHIQKNNAKKSCLIDDSWSGGCTQNTTGRLTND